MIVHTVLVSDLSNHSILVVDELRVIIVDDTVDIWPHDKRNLLQITKYIYFSVAVSIDKRWRSYAEVKRDESLSNGSLANVLKFLVYVHKRYEKKLDSKDLRLLIPDPYQQYCF
ncbi:hypothetical protein ARALYDRAFT_913891 [Arabidopsis lyrata subsp. lyrata]|uniref:protein-serine/threonine phosphatase n=1 Tax=Arabidopsis lyrata subsp. lyrata TaxID=81972 RepID=D7MF74_ARALL|nr:hypothetical protein ARALYDRAFT_913891 [Arabidopsis lyrata subsp. lyrata]